MSLLEQLLNDALSGDPKRIARNRALPQAKVDGMKWRSFRDNTGRIVAIAHCTSKAASKWEKKEGTRASLWKEGESISNKA